MIHLMLEHHEQIDEVMYFETGWKFPQMENHISKVEQNTGIKTIRIRHYRHFNELLGRWGWPKDNYQLLCKNCNWLKEIERRKKSHTKS